VVILSELIPHLDCRTQAAKALIVSSIDTPSVTVPIEKSQHFHPFDQYTAIESRSHQSRFLPPQSLDDPKFFNLAVTFISSCTLQVETPPNPYNRTPEVFQREKRIFQFLSILLASTNGSKDVTAVAGDLRFTSNPPVFRVVYSKNKILTVLDRLRATVLGSVVRSASTKTSDEFVQTIFAFMSQTQETKLKALAREFVKTAPTLATTLLNFVKSKETDWSRVASDIGGDGLIYDMGCSNDISTLASMMTFWDGMIDTANTAQLNLDADAIGLLCKFAFIVSNSTLFLRTVNRLKERSEKEVAFSCYETLRHMAMYYEGARNLYEWVKTEPYQSNLHLFQFAGKDPVSDDDIETICNGNSFRHVRYDHSITPAKMDYLTLIRSRSDQGGYSIHPGRHAFTTRYPALYDWESTNEGTPYSHAEITLALNILHEGTMTGDILFGVSKQCCYLCEIWLNRLNDVYDTTRLIIPSSHKKIYLAWKLSGIRDIDCMVISKVWYKFDELVQNVQYKHPSDTLIPLPLDDIDDIPLRPNELKMIVGISKHFTDEDW